MRILRTETLDHFIFLSTDHVHRVVAEYVHYDNGARPSRAIHRIPDPTGATGLTSDRAAP